MTGDKFFYECNDCQAEYAADKVMYLCPICSRDNVANQPPKGVLKTIFRYDKIKRKVSAHNRFQHLATEGFFSLLPLDELKNLPGLRVGNTPMYRFDRWIGEGTDKQTGGQADRSMEELDFELYLKDDSQNPTFSFKDRASALVSAFAKEHGISTIIAASTGNAGSSLAGICASQGQTSFIFVPSTAPQAKLTQIVMYGARIIPVKGNYDNAFDLSVKATEVFGYYNRNTAYNPLTIEGKKMVSFEIYAQLGYRVPDRIFVPTGDGVIISGVYKGFEDLLKLDIIDHIPTIIAVQAEGSDNLIRNLKAVSFHAIPSETIADSISVDVPRNFYMTKDYLKKYQGEWISVSDNEILLASRELARTTGIFQEPAAVAAFAGMLKYHHGEAIQPGSKNVVLLTGSGLKDLRSVQPLISIPRPIEPDLTSIRDMFKEYLS